MAVRYVYEKNNLQGFEASVNGKSLDLTMEQKCFLFAIAQTGNVSAVKVAILNFV